MITLFKFELLVSPYWEGSLLSPVEKKRMAWDERTDGNKQGSSPSAQCTGEFGYPRDVTHRPDPDTSIAVTETADHFSFKIHYLQNAT